MVFLAFSCHFGYLFGHFQPFLATFGKCFQIFSVWQMIKKNFWFRFNALHKVPILTGFFRISFFNNWNGFSGFQIFAHISLVRSRLLSYQPNLKCFSMKEPKTKMERKPRINSMLVKKYEVPFLGKRLTNDFLVLC